MWLKFPKSWSTTSFLLSCLISLSIISSAGPEYPSGAYIFSSRAFFLDDTAKTILDLVIKTIVSENSQFKSHMKKSVVLTRFYSWEILPSTTT